ncbi:MAG: AAA family ATPase [Geminicoccaceae bacterium]
MEITRLRVSGFKSFSDPVELQLDPGLTGVVGPNGCGKSNIVEALRWAMGESSAKGLRGDEMDDVIFNGSSGRPAHDVAEVRLKLRGRPEGLTGFTEEEELEIARRIGRGSGSSYRINGREARARDVQLLFADAGAGSRSPAIVGQGQIGFIVDSKASDRRKLLEDAAGIGGLQARRREAELRLEATQANLQRVLDLLGTQEARLAELAKQAKQAQRYRQVSAELRATEAQLLLGRHVEASRRAAAANEEVADLQAELGTTEAEAERLRGACAEAAALLPPLREQAAALQAEVTGMQERLGALQAAAGREAEHLAALRRQRDEAARDLAQSEAAVAQLAASLVGADRRAGRARAAAGAGADRAAAVWRPRIGRQRRHWRRRRTVADRAWRSRRGDGPARGGSSPARGDRAARRSGRRRAAGLAAAAVAPAPVAGRVGAGGRRGSARRGAGELVELAARLAELTPAQEAAREAQLAAEREMAAGRERLAAAELRIREAGAVLDRWTERQAANERARLRLAERTAALARRRELHAAAEVDPAASEAELATAEAELAAADQALDGARETLAAAEHARTETAGRLRELRRSADALAAEIRVLESLIPPGSADSLLERLEVPEELGTALAAALGDELLAGTDPAGGRHWGAPATALARPALPAGATPLASLIGAPDILQARLVRTGLIEAEDAERLQPLLPDGHCLVSRDGGLWRWDGYVHAPGGETQAAAGIRHQLCACTRRARSWRRLAATSPQRRRRPSRARRRPARRARRWASTRRAGGRPMRHSCAPGIGSRRCAPLASAGPSRRFSSRARSGRCSRRRPSWPRMPRPTMPARPWSRSRRRRRRRSRPQGATRPSWSAGWAWPERWRRPRPRRWPRPPMRGGAWRRRPSTRRSTWSAAGRRWRSSPAAWSMRRRACGRGRRGCSAKPWSWPSARSRPRPSWPRRKGCATRWSGAVRR